MTATPPHGGIIVITIIIIIMDDVNGGDEPNPRTEACVYERKLRLESSGAL
jgi:hypothetical protein